MYKETGRIDINVAGIVSDLGRREDGRAYIVIDNETIYVKHSSVSLLNKVKQGQYIKMDCYIDSGKIFATNII